MKIELDLEKNLAKNVELYRIANDLKSNEDAIKEMINQFEIRITHTKSQKSEPVYRSGDKKTTLVSVIRKVMISGAQDKTKAVELILKKCKEDSLSVTSKGEPITSKNVLRLLNAIIRDIRKGRVGWWSEYKYVVDDNLIKFEKTL